MVACAALAADDDERARYLSGPARLSMARLRAGRPTRFPTPEEAAEHDFSRRRGAEHQGAVGLGGDRRPRYGAREARRAARAHRRRRADDHDDGPRPRRPGPLLRADRRDLRPAAARRRRRRDDGGHDDDEGRVQRRGVGQDRRGPRDRRTDRDTAQRGGTIRESFAMAKTYAEAAGAHAPATWSARSSRPRRTLDTKEFSSKEDLRTRGLGKIPEAVGLVAAKATLDELVDYREFVLNVAQHAAEADKSGGFLGIGGERVTGQEEAAISDITAALGDEPAPG